MSKAPREESREVYEEKKMLEECGFKLIEKNNLNGLYNAARKFYLRLRRVSNGNGIEELYERYCQENGFKREDADKLYFGFLRRKYPELVRLIVEQTKK